jgi:atypical dual specificity phosphatase
MRLGVSWVLEDRLAASGMLLEGDRGVLAELGITAVLSLTRRNPFESGPPDGLSHLHLAVPDMTCPAPEDLERAVEFIEEHVGSGRRVLVHCGAGLGRTGTVLACYLVARGATAEEAIRRVRQVRPGSVETRSQEDGVRRFAERREGRDRRGGRG